MFLLNWIILMVILQTMGWFLENPNHGYFYNQHSHRLVLMSLHTCYLSLPFSRDCKSSMKLKTTLLLVKLAPITIIRRRKCTFIIIKCSKYFKQENCPQPLIMFKRWIKNLLLNFNRSNTGQHCITIVVGLRKCSSFNYFLKYSKIRHSLWESGRGRI